MYMRGLQKHISLAMGSSYFNGERSAIMTLFATSFDSLGSLQ